MKSIVLMLLFAPHVCNAQTLQPGRGELLYENHCQKCHDKNIHNRDNARATTIGELRTWVISWSVHSGPVWLDEDIEDLVDYLNNRFYRYDD